MAETLMAVTAVTPMVDMHNVTAAAPTIVSPKLKENSFLCFSARR